MNIRDRRPKRALGTLLGLGAFVAAGSAFADIVLFQDDNFKGRSYATQGDVSDLGHEGFNDKASSVEVFNDSWELCSDADFGGNCVVLRPGRYSSLRSEGLNDRVSSVRRAGRHSGSHGGRNSIVLYQDENFSGRSESFSSSTSDLSREGFNDTASSVEINGGSWQLCSDANFRGNCVTLDRGSYSSLRSHGLNDRVSSVRPSSGGSYNSGGYGSNQAPRVLILSNGSGQVTMPTNNCTVYYNNRGSRTTNLRGCDQNQLRQADDAMARHRREQGLNSSGSRDPVITHDEYDDVGAGVGAGAGAGGPPEVVMGSNREGEVIFKGNNCVVYYNASGRRVRNLPACHRDQLSHADQAMASYRREQGM